MCFYLINGCDKLFNQPKDENEGEPKDLSELLSSRIAVAVIPGGIERILVTAKDKDYEKEFFTVISANCLSLNSVDRNGATNGKQS